MDRRGVCVWQTVFERASHLESRLIRFHTSVTSETGFCGFLLFHTKSTKKHEIRALDPKLLYNPFGFCTCLVLQRIP
jgi:hypothetical protein